MDIADPNAAPDDPATVRRNLWANVSPYIFLLYRGRWEDGPPILKFAADLKDLRELVELVIMKRRGDGQQYQYKVIDTNTKLERWFDPSLDPDEQLAWFAEGNGAMAAGLKFEGGFGDKL